MNPDHANTAQMRGLACLPIFFELCGKRVLIAGDTQAAAWKAELCQAAGALVDVFSADPCPALIALAEGCKRVNLVRRRFEPQDFRGIVLAVGALEDAAEAARFSAEAQVERVPVNIVDRLEDSDFQFGAIVDRSPLVIAISTDGAAPVLAQTLRRQIETLLPRNIGLWTAAAKYWRRRLKDLDLSAQAVRRFWEFFSAKALDPAASAPGETGFETLLAEAAADTETGARLGSVALVGAGPGDPELLTLKALRLLQSADVILYDDLVVADALKMARREAEKISVGKRGYRPSCRQDHIVSLLIAHALAGKRVVRLKGGDPMIFGRANEEIAALREVGIPVEIVPGVTAALGAAAALQLSLTEREKARRVQFVTAHAHDGALPEDFDWRSLCDPRASSVVYMGVRTLKALATRLLEHGLDPLTPAILVERATWPDERRIHATIADLPTKVAADEPTGPCVILFGAAFGVGVEDALRALGSEQKPALLTKSALEPPSENYRR